MNNQEFKWDDSLVKEIVTNALDLMHETTKHDCSQDCIEKFKASKQKQPILVTHDGVKLFEGDTLYYVLINDGWKIHSNPANKCDGNNKDYKYFSIKEAAEEYVALNKLCLSAAEVYAITAIYGLPAVAIEKDIEKLVKSKNK